VSQTTTTNSQWPHNNNPHDDTASRDNYKERAHPRRPQAPWRLRDLHLVLGMAKLPIQSASTRALFGMYRVTERCRYIASATSTAAGSEGPASRVTTCFTAPHREKAYLTLSTPRIRGQSPTMHPATRVEVGVKLSKFIQHSKQKETGPERDSPSLGWSRSVFGDTSE
jgi:hypothetical protein